jgi:hypothetical protein
VLFNLYNFPGGVGIDPSQFASLTLIDCKFEFFFRDYEALIYVENNNMQIQNFTASSNSDTDPKNLMIFSDDRGANIKIVRSEFKNSRFCKGLVVYERTPKLQSSSNKIVSLAKEYWVRYPYEFKALPSISI